ncbi:MAG: glutathione binding-like protein [Reyranellaceae bacterium]
MDLFFSPLACSLASRMALYEAGAAATAATTFVQVDSATKRTAQGDDYRTINPLGLVPALRLDDGAVLLENAAILQHIADRHPAAGLAPPAGGLARARLQQWLSFVGSELHKGLFTRLFDKDTPPAVRTRTLETGARRLALLERHLANRDWLLESFSVADCYLATVLNWKIATPVDLAPWPAVAAHFARVTTRPAVARALEEEFALYAAAQQRKAS